MAAQPELQNAYAMHWLAAREAGAMPAFQQMTQPMLWGLYGKTALAGLLRYALSGRATPDVMAGIVDQMNLIQQSYTQSVQGMRNFMDQPETGDFAMVAGMSRAWQPMDRVYQNMQTPFQTVMGGVQWSPGAPAPMFGFGIAMVPGQAPTVVTYQAPGVTGQVMQTGQVTGQVTTGAAGQVTIGTGMPGPEQMQMPNPEQRPMAGEMDDGL